LFALPFLWSLGSSELFYIGDLVYPFRALHTLHTSIYMWNPSLFLGWDASQTAPQVFPHFVTIAFLEILGLPTLAAQNTWLGLVLAFPFLTMCLFVLSLLPSGRHRITAGVVAGLAYALHPYVFGQWNPGQQMLMYMYAALPLTLSVFFVGLQTRRWSHAFLFGLATLIGAPTASNPPAVIVAALVALSFFVADTIRRKSEKIVGRAYFLGSCILCSLAVNAWWILPWFYYAGSSFPSTDVAKQYLGWIQRLASGVSLLSVLRGLAGTGIGLMFDNVPYVTSSDYFLHNGLAIASSLALPFFAVTAILWRPGRWELWLGAVLVTFAFLAKGSKPPFGEWFSWAFLEIPGFVMFRSVTKKMSAPVAFAIASLVGLFAAEAAQRLEGILGGPRRASMAVGTLVSLIIVVLMWPLVSGQVVEPRRGPLPAARARLPPSYYDEAARWLAAAPQGRVLLLPSQYLLYAAYTWGLAGSDFLPLFFDRSLIYRQEEYGSPLSFQSVKALYTALADGQPEALTRLREANVRYILVRGDLSLQPYDLSPDYVSASTSQALAVPGVRLAQQFGPLMFYEVPDPYPLILGESRGDDDPYVELAWRELSPTHYVVQVAAGQSVKRILFLTSYHSGWSATVVGGTTLTDHTVAFGYANAWEVNTTGPMTIDLQYHGQRLFLLGSTLSLATLGLGTLLLTVAAVRRKRIQGSFLAA
jgi:hypothetical protein